MSATTLSATPGRELDLGLLAMLLARLDQERTTGRPHPEVALLREQVRRGDLMRSAHADAAAAYLDAGGGERPPPCLLLTAGQEAWLGRDPTPLSVLDFLR